MGTDAMPVLDRRTAVTGAVGIAALGAVAACGGGATTGATAGGVTAGDTAPAVPVPPTTGAAVTGIGSTGTKLGPAADVPVGGGTVYQDLEVVVTQPVAGRFEGLSAVCTHTGCIVDKVASGLIECPCHGSRYHLDGTVARGPAPRALTQRPVTVVDGTIVLT
ncbi:MAG: Rieske (2Fe-2S) protein [Pseudonocardiales bacterium]|nr:Rieske (2Fe-2S) protein [Pseudonocardiales bacterium]